MSLPSSKTAVCIGYRIEGSDYVFQIDEADKVNISMWAIDTKLRRPLYPDRLRIMLVSLEQQQHGSSADTCRVQMMQRADVSKHYEDVDERFVSCGIFAMNPRFPQSDGLAYAVQVLTDSEQGDQGPTRRDWQTVASVPLVRLLQEQAQAQEQAQEQAPNMFSQLAIVHKPGCLSRTEVSSLIGAVLDPESGVLHQNGTVMSGASMQVTKSIRKSRIRWLLRNDARFGWLYDRIIHTVKAENARTWMFDISTDPADWDAGIQFTEYFAEEGGFYDWHVDTGERNGAERRKISVIVQLSDPAEYEGGSLYLASNGPDLDRPRQDWRGAGSIVMFPSYILHRVSPVTSGIRRSLVCWICGKEPMR